MADWYYYNESGEKMGPVRGRELKELAQIGTVTPETKVENSEGHTAFAKNVTGLPFSEKAQSETKPSDSAIISSPPVEANPFIVPTPVEKNPFALAPPQHIPVPISDEGKASHWITLIGVAALLVVCGIGWLIISSTSTVQPTTDTPTIQPTTAAPNMEWIPIVGGVIKTADRRSCLTYLGVLKNAVDLYAVHVGYPPTTEQGLEALVHCPSGLDEGEWGGPYIHDNATSKDPWGSYYQYASPPSRSGSTTRDFEIWSFGPDRRDGTDDDVGSWMNK